jgi:mono/diheme cytochrome c family protein
MIRILLFAVAVGTVSPLVVPAPSNPLADPLVVQGRQLVRQNCVGCHSAQTDGISVLSSAPPFRWMKGMRPDALKLLAAEAGRGDHAGMPAIYLTDSEAGAISAYIHALANAAPKAQKTLSLPPCVGRVC